MYKKKNFKSLISILVRSELWRTGKRNGPHTEEAGREEMGVAGDGLRGRVARHLRHAEPPWESVEAPSRTICCPGMEA